MKYISSYRLFEDLDRSRVPSLEYDISMILSDMTDDGFKLDIDFGRSKSIVYWYYVNIFLPGTSYRDKSNKLSDYTDSLYHFINYIKDEGFSIYYIDLYLLDLKRDLRSNVELGEYSSLEDIEKSFNENGDKMLTSIKFSFNFNI